MENSLQHITGSSSAGYLTAHLGSSLGFTIAPESLDSSAAKVRRWVSRDTFGPERYVRSPCLSKKKYNKTLSFLSNMLWCFCMFMLDFGLYKKKQFLHIAFLFVFLVQTSSKDYCVVNKLFSQSNC